MSIRNKNFDTGRDFVYGESQDEWYTDFNDTFDALYTLARRFLE